MTKKGSNDGREARIERLSKARAAASAEKADSVRAQLRESHRNGDVISVRGIARQSGVSHQFIYSNRDLLSAVEAAMDTQRSSNVSGQKAPRQTDAAASSLRADLAIAHQETKRLRDEVRQLRGDLKLDLGAQIEAQEREDLASLLKEKTRENDRLVSKIQKLERQVAALTRERDDLADDLAAERAAQKALAKASNVRPIRGQ